MDRGFGSRDRYDDRSRDYDRGGNSQGFSRAERVGARPPPWPATNWESPKFPNFCHCDSGLRYPQSLSDGSISFPGYDSRIGSGRRAFGSGYRRDDDYRGYDDRYDRRDDRMDRWNSRDDYGRDDFRREDRGGLGKGMSPWEWWDETGSMR